MVSPTSATDVVVYTQDYTTYCGRPWHPQVNGPSTVGLTTCVSPNSGASTCEKHEVRYDLSWWNQNMDNGYRRDMACHETGHTLGLRHPEDVDVADLNSCVKQNAGTIDYISEHDASHMNGGPWRLVPGSALMGDTLNQGQQMVSWDGRFVLVMQGDGNLVIYGPSGPTWATGTNNGYRTWAVMQGDGNFVVYSNDGWATFARCSTRTAGHPGSFIKLQTDGNLIIVYPGDIAGWATFSGGRCN
jgi:hypothetical protein